MFWIFCLVVNQKAMLEDDFEKQSKRKEALQKAILEEEREINQKKGEIEAIMDKFNRSSNIFYLLAYLYFIGYNLL